jgi:hypothetical protein
VTEPWHGENRERARSSTRTATSSRSSRQTARARNWTKQAFHEEHGVEAYYIYDPDHNRLEAFVRRGVLRRVQPVNGFISPRLGIRFDLSGTELAIIGPDGHRFLTFQEAYAAHAQVEQQIAQAEQETARANEQRANWTEQRRTIDAEIPCRAGSRGASGGGGR